MISGQIVTAWYRDGEFNHISTGFHPDHAEPPYVSEEQGKAWANQAWTPKRALLKDGVLHV